MYSSVQRPHSPASSDSGEGAVVKEDKMEKKKKKKKRHKEHSGSEVSFLIWQLPPVNKS